MQDLVNRIASQLGVSPEMAASAVGIILNMFKSVLPAELLEKLMAAMPGAADMAAQAPADGGAEAGGGLGGLLGGLAGALGGGAGGGAGALMETLGKLQGLGLDTDQSKAIGQQVLGYVQAKASPELLEEVKQHIPALDQLL